MKIFEVFPLVQLGCLIVVAFVLRIHTIYNLKTHLYLIQCDVSQSNAPFLLTAANNPELVLPTPRSVCAGVVNVHDLVKITQNLIFLLGSLFPIIRVSQQIDP